jgi:hypothetical protein
MTATVHTFMLRATSCLATLVGLTVSSSAAAMTKIAILPIQRDGAAAAELPALIDEVLLSAVQGSGDLRVVGKSDLEVLLGSEEQRDLLGCDETTCFSEIGKTLAVDKLIAGQIAMIPDGALISLKLIDLTTAVVEGRTTQVVRGDSRAIVDALPGIVRQLFASAKDSDRDGIGDLADRCPAELEDKNTFEDNDGCADELRRRAARPEEGDIVARMRDREVAKADDENAARVRRGLWLVAFGAVSGGGAGVFGWLGEKRNDEIQAGGYASRDELQSAVDRGFWLNVGTIALGVVSAGLLGLGGYFIAGDSGTEP